LLRQSFSINSKKKYYTTGINFWYFTVWHHLFLNIPIPIYLVSSVPDPKLIISDPGPDPPIENQEFWIWIRIRIWILDPDPSVN
jgi:hypothetical protein